MNRRKLREKTGLIVRKNGEFLQCVDAMRRLRWSTSPYDAWITRSEEKAKSVAEKVNSELWLFNPIVGTLRKYQR